MKLRCKHYQLVPMYLNEEERVNFYHGCSNEILWPLFHDLQSRCNFEPEYWNSYAKVNQKFARALLDVAESNDFVWVQDYHLMLVAESVRAAGSNLELAYFHHIPFPSPDIFEKLPWRAEVLSSLAAVQPGGISDKARSPKFRLLRQAVCSRR